MRNVWPNLRRKSKDLKVTVWCASVTSDVAKAKISYDTIWYDSVYLTCSKKLTGSQGPNYKKKSYDDLMTYEYIKSNLWQSYDRS